MKTIRVGQQSIGLDSPPFVVAELSGNHDQSLEKALATVDAAAAAGVPCLKLQTYTPDTMTLDVNEKEFFVNDVNGLWGNVSLYSLYQKAYTPWEWHKKIFDRCKSHGMLCFSTPFDSTAVDFLEELNAPLYKIASFENGDLPLIKRVAQTGKPIIMSTGMATIPELSEAIEIIRQTSESPIVLLKCTSAYPADPIDSNLNTLPHLSNLFDVLVGISDHTLGIGVAVAAVALRAVFIEKHLTLSRKDGGVDSSFSLEPEEFKSLVVESKRAWLSLGKVKYGATSKELDSRRWRRSLYVSKDIKKGELLSELNIKSIRPGYGLAPKHYWKVIGKPAKVDLKKGTALNWDHI